MSEPVIVVNLLPEPEASEGCQENYSFSFLILLLNKL